MEIPTINIVMSFDPEEVFTFLESKTLDIFKDKSKSPKDTYFFRNGPASSFKSLVHSVGYEGESGTPKLEIEFVDPEELFEHRMTSFTVKGMIPEEGNLIEDQLKKLRRNLNDAAGEERAFRGLLSTEKLLLVELQNRKRAEEQDDASAKDLEAKIAVTTELITVLKNDIAMFKEARIANQKIFDAAIDEKGGDGGGSIDYDKVSQLDAETRATVREYNESVFKRSIWISYGVGDLLENWCPPMVFDTAVGAEYTVGGKNARVLKLKYDGVSSRPTNTATSHFLSKVGARIVCKGTSGRILNASAMEAKKKYYNDLNTTNEYFPYFNHGLYFSIHEIITDVLTDYIRNASSNDNVLVVVPDLDILLLDKLTASMKSSGVNWFLRSSEKPKVATSYAEFAKVLKGLTSFFEDLGMQLTDRRFGVNVAGTLALKNVEQEVTNPDEVPNYLQTNNYHISLTSDIGQDNHLEALEEVSNAISKAAIASYKGSNTAVPDESFDFKEYVVNDFVLLKALARKGLIPTASEPLYIFGTSKMVNDFVFGQIAFTTETGEISSISQVSGQTINDAELPQHISLAAFRIHPLDRIKGLDETYIKTMALYQDPSLAFSPFGFDAIRVNDIDVTISDKIKNKFTVPIFSIGTRNSNVMNLKLDYNKNYLVALTSLKYSPDTRNTQITGIVDDSKVSDKITRVFTQFDDLDLDQVRQKGDNPEWIKFKKLVDPYRDTSYRYQLWGQGKQDKDAGDMLDIFEEISSPEAAETLKTALSERGGDDEEEYYDLMLTSLEALSLATPAQVVTTPVGKGTSSVVRATTLLFERLKKMAIIGTVKTLPLFQLSSMKRTINKPCLIYAVEPRFQGVKRHADAIKGPPFYTGMYTIAGFKHTISGNSAYSEFKINKAGTN